MDEEKGRGRLLRRDERKTGKERAGAEETEWAEAPVLYYGEYGQANVTLGKEHSCLLLNSLHVHLLKKKKKSCWIQNKPVFYIMISSEGTKWENLCSFPYKKRNWWERGKRENVNFRRIYKSFYVVKL
jgi:hypothetical protein